MLRRSIAPVAALLAAGIVGGLAAVAAWEALDADPVPAGAQTVEPPAQPASAELPPSSIVDVVKQVMPAVVEVRAEGRGEPEESPFPFPVPTPPAPERPGGLGSGFVIDDEGHVVTNQHVVGQASRATVTLEDGTEVGARVLGTDPSTDVAVLALDEQPDGLQRLELGASESLEIGQTVIAIGSPFGLQGTVTAGIVSARDRDIRAPNGFTIDGVIQTDAALNQGNSGGPLIDLAGRVVGMNAQIASDSGANSGIGYAIPIETVREIAQKLIEDGKVEHPYLGVQVENANGDGARIAQVVPGSPAARGGLREGDVVTEAGGEPVRSADDLRLAVAGGSPGAELELTLRRDGETRTVTVTLGTRPSSSA